MYSNSLLRDSVGTGGTGVCSRSSSSQQQRQKNGDVGSISQGAGFLEIGSRIEEMCSSENF